MSSNVCMKCFLLTSMLAESCWLVARLEWMSSMRPLRYFVVTCGNSQSQIIIKGFAKRLMEYGAVVGNKLTDSFFWSK
jgi:hypothetical protein